MKKYPLIWIDAFTTVALGGNPCPVLLDADDISPELRQRIAKEMNQSETAYALKSKVADFGARYYTPAEEIPLAGHPTVSLVTALVDAGRITLGDKPVALTLELRDGPIDVTVQRGSVPAATRVTMTQRKPVFTRTYTPEEMMPCFGLTRADLLPGKPIQTVNTGTPFVMVPLTNHEALGRARLDFEKFAALKAMGDFFSPHLFALGGFTPQGDVAARHFSLPPDLLEDPVTGSATGCMSAYLWHYGLMPNPTFVCEQGHNLGRPGRVDAEVVGPREGIETVKISGDAVVVMRGELQI
ncbi:MAG TPA: PhzF family phenazine biosynthesis protein [Gemmatimonadales bacterium]|nr:PhzF family phenazine biosynthesis protein [Gemmatimonadales bacterium]